MSFQKKQKRKREEDATYQPRKRGKRACKEGSGEMYENCSKLYAGKPRAEVEFVAADIKYQERLRAIYAAGQTPIELRRLCGRNAVRLYSPWEMDGSLQTALENLIEDDVDDWEIKFVNHVMKFILQILEEVNAKCHKVFVISPHVCFEDVAYFFLGPMLRRAKGAQMACSWASMVGFLLSKQDIGTVTHLWSALPPEVRGNGK